MNKNKLKFAVIGTGNSAHAIAAHIAIKGFMVNIGCLPEFQERLTFLKEKGSINLISSDLEKKANLNMVSSDLKKVIQGVDIIFIATMPYRHRSLIKAMSPYFEDNQYIVFISNFGALRFIQWTKELNIKAKVTPVETISLFCAARLIEPGTVKIFAEKDNLYTAAIPVHKTKDFIKKITNVFPQTIPAENALFISLSNINPIFHCGSEQIGEDLDKERIAVLKGLGAKHILSARDIFVGFYKQYGVKGKTLTQAINKSPFSNTAKNIKSSSMEKRFLTEDIPYNLAPWASIADRLNISTPTIDALIHKASLLTGIDYFHEIQITIN